MRHAFAAAAFAAFILTYWPHAACAAGRPPAAPVVTVTAAGGLVRVVTQSIEGEIELLLPDDIRPAETVSGSVSVRAAGVTEAERQANHETLARTTIEMFGQTTAAGGGVVTWKTPDFLVGLTAPLLVRLGGTEPAASAAVPVLALPSAPPDPAGPPRIIIPPKGKAGRLLQLFGGFDGDLLNTRVTFGEREVTVLAESPRKCVVLTPADLSGMTLLSIREGGFEVSGDYMSVRGGRRRLLWAVGVAAAAVTVTTLAAR